MGAYLHTFDPDSQVSLFGLTYQYTSTHSTIAGAFARTSFGADHHRIVGIAVFGYIKNDYEDYLGTGQPLKTNDDLKAVAARYLYRVKGDWFIGAQGSAANYQVLGESAQDDLVLETLGVRGFESAALGAVAMHDSRDNQDMPTARLVSEREQPRLPRGAWRSVDVRRLSRRLAGLLAARWRPRPGVQAVQLAHARRTVSRAGDRRAARLQVRRVSRAVHVVVRSRGARVLRRTMGRHAVRRSGRPVRRERRRLDRARLLPDLGRVAFTSSSSPAQRMLVNLEYAQGVEDNRGVYLKFGYGW